MTDPAQRQEAVDHLMVQVSGRAHGWGAAYRPRLDAQHRSGYVEEYVQGDGLGLAVAVRGWDELFGYRDEYLPGPGGRGGAVDTTVMYRAVNDSWQYDRTGTVFAPPGTRVRRVTIPDDLVGLRYVVREVNDAGVELHRWVAPDPALVQISLHQPMFGVPFKRQATYEVSVEAAWADATTTRTAQPALVNVDEYLFVSIGDSYASGEGNPDRSGSTNIFGAVPCQLVTLATLWDEYGDYTPIGIADQIGNAVYDVLPAKVRAGVDTLRDIGDSALDTISSMIGGGEHQEARWLEPRAHRSTANSHSFAASQFEGAHRWVPSERMNRADLVTFVSYARSGSTVRQGLLGPRARDADRTVVMPGGARVIPGWNNQGQLLEAKTATAGRQIDVMLLSIGGNDAGFATRVAALTNDVGSALGRIAAAVLGGSISANTATSFRSASQGERDEIEAAVRAFIEGPDDAGPGMSLARELTDVRDAIATFDPPPANVLIVGYPVGMFSKEDPDHPNDSSRWIDAAGCGLFTSWLPIIDLSIDDVRLINALNRRLNERLRELVGAFDRTRVGGTKWWYVESFSGHGYCARSNWYIGATESCTRQGDLEGVLHPNRDGHNATADAIAAKLERMRIRRRPGRGIDGVTTITRGPRTGRRAPGVHQ